MPRSPRVVLSSVVADRRRQLALSCPSGGEGPVLDTTSGHRQTVSVSIPEKRGALRQFAAGVIRSSATLLTRRIWLGQEHLPPTGVVVACNHLSEYDPVAIAHYIYDAGRFPRFLGKDGVFAIPVVGRLLHDLGQIPVHRESTRAGEALRAAIDAAREGACVVVYPEATITRDPDLWPMTAKTGAVRIALHAGVPLVPLATWGAQDLLPYRGAPRPVPRKTVRIKAGPPVDLAAYAGRGDDPVAMAEATDVVMRHIAEQLAALRGERAPEVLYERDRGES
ncbi:MAG: 1-acyl-sn-glycerol-3-phosphate acyltransferase [Streptosporangiales bacterium]|nr:1-acyl-sn-glycerol-3-phosphate acyltransferase [Streptosporangiales bacterium]